MKPPLEESPSQGRPEEEGWQVRSLSSGVLPWNSAPIRPAEIGDGLCAAMLRRENVLEDANYQKIAPNRYVVEISQENYSRNYLPLEDQILRQWQEKLLERLLTANSRQGRQEYRFAGPVQVEIRPVAGLSNSQARLLCRVQPEKGVFQTSGLQTGGLQSGLPPASLTGLQACLEAVAGGQRWALSPGMNTLGREASCDIYLDMPDVQQKKLVSGRHASLYCQAGSFRLFDGAPGGGPSLNGTFVNFRRVPPEGVELKDGDLVILAALDASRPDPDTPGAAALRFHLDCR